MRKVNDWSEVTVGQYQEMMLVETENDVTKFIEQISIILDCDPSDIRNMPYGDYKEISEKMSFISKQPKEIILREFEIDGVEYGLEPDMNLITAGVFIDAEQFKQDPITNLHMSLALIYRPITKRIGDDYEIEPHKAIGFEKRANLFKDKVSIETVLGATLFFSLLGMELSIATLESFNKEATKN
jgi:hypothetical protein